MPYYVLRFLNGAYAVTVKSLSLGEGVKEMDYIAETSEMAPGDILQLANHYWIFRGTQQEERWERLGEAVPTQIGPWTFNKQRDMSTLIMNYVPA